MINIIVELSKYVILTLMVIYTFHCFYMVKKQDEEEKNEALRQQLMLIFFMDFIPTLRQPCMLVISGTDMSVEPALQALLKQYAPRAKVRSRNVPKRGVEWIFELQTKKEMELMEKLVILEGIQSANLLTHDGDVRF